MVLGKGVGMAVDLNFEIDFGRDGNNSDRIGVGWAKPEANGSRWSLGENSKIELPPLAASEAHALVIAATPFAHPPKLPSQRISLYAGEVCFGRSSFATPS